MSSLSWFSRAVLGWYAGGHRDLPWRRTRDPYRIWLSEVLLQQTRVDQGLPYYQRFIRQWPTVRALAAADEQEVLKAWQGLGYYRRARNLLAAARQVMNDHGGRFPDKAAALRSLKGVGDYTAAAIASISFGRPEAVVDGNVYRVLARVFGMDSPIDTTVGRKAFAQLAAELLDPGHAGDHNQAVMELGAVVCLPRVPRCDRCPVAQRCLAHRQGRIDRLPVKAGRVRTVERHFNHLCIATEGGLVLRERTGKDIWQGLHEPPLIESQGPLPPAAFKAALRRQLGTGWKVHGHIGPVRHVLSHQVLHLTFWEVTPPRTFAPPSDWRAVSGPHLIRYPVPRPIERYLAQRLR